MMKRILCLCLAALTCCTILAGCGKGNEGTKDTGELNNNERAQAYFDKAGIKTGLETVVMTIGEIEITYENYRYLYMSCRNSYEEQGIAKTADEIKAEVLTELFYEAAVQTLANRYNAGLTDKQKSSIEDQVNSLIKTYSDYGYELDDIFASKYMTANVYEFSYGFEYFLPNNVFEHCKDPKNNVLDFSENSIDEKMEEYDRMLMVFVGVNETRTDANALKKAEGILEKLNNGEDFAKIAKEYSDDMGTDPAVGFYFTEDSVDENFKDAYYALEEGDYTHEAIQTEDGYYIIYRTTPDKEYFSKELYPYYAFNDHLQKTQESLSVTYTEFFTGMFDGKDLIPEKGA